MTGMNLIQNCKLLDDIMASCLEIRHALTEHLEATSNIQYKADIEKDIVTIKNLKSIVKAVKKDIEIERAGASTELLLRIAANDFKNKLSLIPEKKTVRNEIVKSLNEVHRNILHVTIRET